MAWFNATDNQSGNSNIVQQDNLNGQSYYIRYDPDNNFQYSFNGAGILISPLPTYDVWHHVALSWDGTSVKFYLDGTEISDLPDRQLHTAHLH